MKTLRSIDDLKPAPWNPREISEEALTALGFSLQEFGDLSGIVWNSKSGNLVCGHQRLKALQAEYGDKLKLRDGILSANGKKYPVRKVNWPKAKERAANIAANSPELAGMFTSGLDDILKPLKLEMPEEFEALRFAELLTPITEIPEGADDVPETPTEAITKPGEIFELGPHRVMCGDCTKSEEVGRLLGDVRWGALVTSPPYNSGNGGYKTDYHGTTKRFYVTNSDNWTEPEYVEFCNSVLVVAERLRAADDSPVVWNVTPTARCRKGYGEVLFAGAHGFTVKESIVWDKGKGFPSASKGILSRRVEFVFVLSVGDTYYTTQGKNEPRWNRWDISRPDKQGDGHHATFPVALPLRAIRDFTRENATVFDPFLGSGTTLIAADMLGRVCYGMEIEPKYCDVIKKRWENYQASKAA